MGIIYQVKALSLQKNTGRFFNRGMVSQKSNTRMKNQKPQSLRWGIGDREGSPTGRPPQARPSTKSPQIGHFAPDFFGRF